MWIKTVGSAARIEPAIGKFHWTACPPARLARATAIGCAAGCVKRAVHEAGRRKSPSHSAGACLPLEGRSNDFAVLLRDAQSPR